MQQQNFKFYLIILTLTVINATRAKKCGELICDEISECKHSPENGKYFCICPDGYSTKLLHKIVQCSQDGNIKDEEKCFRFGDKCGPNHHCDGELVCMEIINQKGNTTGELVDNIICPDKQQKCLNKCCGENAICQDGLKCISSPKVSQAMGCPESEKCLDKCCKESEFCFNKITCMAKESSNVITESENDHCLEPYKCKGHCCSNNEICRDGEQCVTVNNVTNLFENKTSQCLDKRKCGDNCCSDSEVCQDGNECIAKENDILNCVGLEKCLNICCAPNEICQANNTCVVKPSTVLECPEENFCQGTCCAENEACVDGNKCMAKALNYTLVTPEYFNFPELTTVTDNLLNCPLSQKCANTCCPPKQICNKNNECVSTAEAKALTVALNCSLAQICHDTCCSEYEKCSETKECISVYSLECQENEKCGHKCCPVNETCNDANECVAYIEITTIENCPENQKCLDSCCLADEQCSELYECINNNLEDFINLYNFPNTNATSNAKVTNNIDAAVSLYDFDNFKSIVSCPNDHYPCQQKCCTAEQICNARGECLENANKIDCEVGQNCLESATARNTQMPITYTAMGLACLAAALTFGLFKLYSLRHRNSYSF